MALDEPNADSGKGKEMQGQFSQEQKALQIREAFVIFVMCNLTKPTWIRKNWRPQRTFILLKEQ